MLPDELNYAIKIKNILMKKPCATVFLEPVDPNSEFAPNYYLKIRKPIDFGTIQEKLLAKEYKSLNDWEHDITLIWQNTEKFFGKISYMTALSTELKNSFYKIKDLEIPDDIKSWMFIISKLQQKLEKIFKEAPPKLNKNWKKQIKLLPLNPMNNNRKKKLIEASNLLKSTHDARNIFSIIQKQNPEINAYSEHVEIDIINLKPKTHWYIEWYLRKRFEEEGLNYP